MIFAREKKYRSTLKKNRFSRRFLELSQKPKERSARQVFLPAR